MAAGEQLLRKRKKSELRKTRTFRGSLQKLKTEAKHTTKNERKNDKPGKHEKNHPLTENEQARRKR